MQNVYPVGLFFSNTQDFAFAPFEKMLIKKLASCLQVRTLHATEGMA